VKAVDGVLDKVDGWQRANRVAAPAYAVVKKFGDDSLNQFVVGLGWYGFLAIYPLLLVVTTIFGFIGVASLGHGIVNTLHQFPVIGTQFNPANGSNNLHGSVFGLVIGLLGLIYGAQGVTQTAQQAMAKAWNISKLDAPGFLPRLARSLIALVIIGGSFVVNAAVATFATSSGEALGIRVGTLVGMLIVNVGFFWSSFRALTPHRVRTRALLPGAIVGSVGFTVLITVGSGLIQHQVRNSSATYGQFGVVIGLVGFLLLLAKISLYGAELNPVLERHLWPRGLVNRNPTAADEQVLRDIAHENQTRPDQVIGVGFGKDPIEEADADARLSRQTAEKEVG
jgi:uncharacterized BrkB/YihY/UPF0761 family membrane protein